MIVLVLSILWVMWIVYSVHTSNETLVNEQQVIDKYHLPITVRQIGVGVHIINKYQLRYDYAVFKRFIRYADSVFIKGSGQAVHYLILAKQISYFCVGLPIVMSTLHLSLKVFVFVSSVFIWIIFNMRYAIKKRYLAKQKEMTSQLANVLFQFVLLLSAGYALMACFKQVALSKKGVLYDEMKGCLNDIDCGVAQVEALALLASRCDDKEIKRMINLLMQTQQKGSEEMGKLFFEMSRLNWQKNKAAVIKKAQDAATKLLLPSGIIFLGIILMMLLPLVVNGFLV